MDEATIEQSISDYRLQLSQIESLLCSCDEENREELMHLKQDVTDLIKVTEETLLSLKKGRLLKQLSDKKQEADVFRENAMTESSSQHHTSDADQMTTTHDFLGTRCRVRYTFDWGTTEYHNAMVLSIEESSDGHSKAKVLFMNPTHVSMVPCSYFLNGTCKFIEENCRFSHGYLVDISEMEEYVEPDFSKLFEDEKCLARYDDNIWYKATIRKILDDERVEVHYDTYNTDAILDVHLVLPMEVRNEESSSSSESELDDGCSRDVHEDKFIAQLSREPLSSNGPLGEWEMHTRGIGSKLMAKMGYVFGKGLGKEGEGRVEPIEITILPAGKSLDMVAELREKGRLHKPMRKKKAKSFAQVEGASAGCGRGSGSSPSQASDVFSFINERLTNNDSQKNDNDFHDQKVRHNIEDSYQQMKQIRMRKKKGQSGHSKHVTGPNWNIQLFKNNEKSAALRKQLTKQKESLKRNLGRDDEMVARLRSSISSIEKELYDLEQSGKVIENKLNSKAQHKKLTVF